MKVTHLEKPKNLTESAPLPPKEDSAQNKKRNALLAATSRFLPFAIAAVLVIIGGAAIFREASHFSLSEVKQAVQALPAFSLFKAGAATLLAYFLLSFYDYFGAWYAKDPQPWIKSALAAFCSYVLAHNLGCTAISGAAVRYRLYRAWGMSAADVARIVIFCTWACGIGMLFLSGIALLFQADAIPFSWVTSSVTIPLGLLCLGIVFVYMLLSLRGGKIKFRSWELVMPSPFLALSQLLVSALDMGVTALILWCVLGNPHPSSLPPLGFVGFMGLYLAAYLAGILSSVPGGVGVFDAFLLTMLLPWFSAPQILGGLVVFRSFYYLIPLLLAGVLFTGHEIFLRFFKKEQVSAASQEGIHFEEGDFPTQIGAFVQFIFGIGIAVYALLGLPGKESNFLLEVTLFFLGALMAGLAFSLGQKVFAAWRASIIVLVGLFPFLFFLHADFIALFSDFLVLLIIVPFRRYYYREAHMVAFPNIPAAIASSLLALLILGGTAWTALERRSGEMLWFPKNLTSVSLAIAALIFGLMIFLAFRRTRIHLSFWKENEIKKHYAIAEVIPNCFLVEPSGQAWDPCLYLDATWDHRILLALGRPYGEERHFASVVWRMRDFAIQEGAILAWLVPENTKWKKGEALLEKIGLEKIVWKKDWLLYTYPSQMHILLHFLNDKRYPEVKSVV